jgi:molybdopterin converting factor small subunit
MMSVTVEFFGVPRQRAGTARAVIELDANSARLGDVLLALASKFPELSATCFDGDRLRAGYVANVDGERFILDAETPLGGSESLLILSADAGG